MSIYTTASFGVSDLIPEDDKYKIRSYQKVDEALYRAKDKKNCVVVYN